MLAHLLPGTTECRQRPGEATQRKSYLEGLGDRLRNEGSQVCREDHDELVEEGDVHELWRSEAAREAESIRSHIVRSRTLS